jgi:hypothetical protein
MKKPPDVRARLALLRLAPADLRTAAGGDATVDIDDDGDLASVEKLPGKRKPPH